MFIVDDDPMVRRALGRVLSLAGFDVDACESALAFLERLPHDGPACVILNQKMPGMTGLELQAALESRRAEQGLLIVFLTGHGDIAMSVRAMKAGAFDFLSKPVEEGPIIDTVGRALAESGRLRLLAQERQSFLDRVLRLTARERQVCALVVRGLLNKEVAAELGIAGSGSRISPRPHDGQALGPLGCRVVAPRRAVRRR